MTGGVFHEGNEQPLAFIIVLTSNKTVSMVRALWDRLLCCDRWRPAFSLEGNLLQPIREPEPVMMFQTNMIFHSSTFFFFPPPEFSPPLLLL